MSAYDRRLDKLEEAIGVAGCLCNAGPALIVVRQGVDPMPPKRERCPVHGFELPRQIVIIRSVEDVCQPRPEREWHEQLPGGCVAVNLPPPERLESQEHSHGMDR